MEKAEKAAWAQALAVPWKSAGIYAKVRETWKLLCGRGAPSWLWKREVCHLSLLTPSGNTSASSSAADSFYIRTWMTLSGVSLTALAFLVKH